MSSPKVLVVGCGISGPVIALLLHRKGYQPVVLEKVKQLGDVGGSIMMMPNGLKVLALLGLDKIATEAAPHLVAMHDRKSTGENLGSSQLPKDWSSKYTQPACGVKRTRLNLALKDAFLASSIPLYEDWKLASLTETTGGVIATASDGRTMEGAFLIGCDGLKSVTRSLVLAQHGRIEGDAEFTGLTQTGGLSPTPAFLKEEPAMLNIYGPGAHLIAYPSSETTAAWAITQTDSVETQESWKAFSEVESAALKEKLLEEFKDWCEPFAELVKGAERLIKYGLFDRPQLDPEFWVSKGGRCVLIGDAAHPTSPHLGQGANQALEDCYHLARMLPDFDNQKEITSNQLAKIFAEFAALRQPKTAELVRGARKQGEDRVVSGGPKKCEERDERMRRRWDDKAAVEARYDYLLKEPFQQGF